MTRKTTFLTAAALCVSMIAAPAFADFNADYKAARDLYSKKEYAQAIVAFEKLYGEAQTDALKQAMLYYAFYSSLNNKEYDKAVGFSKKMAKEEDSVNFETRVYYAQREYQKVADLYGSKDLTKWSPAAAAAGYGVYAAAEQLLKNYDKALELTDKALAVEPSGRNRAGHWLRRGDILRVNKQDLPEALKSYQKVYEDSDQPIHFATAATRIGRLYIQQGKGQLALDELKREGLDQVTTGHYAVDMILVRAEALASMGKKDEAIKAYQEALEHPSASEGQKKNIQRAIDNLNK